MQLQCLTINSHAYAKFMFRIGPGIIFNFFFAQGEDDVEGGAVHETSGRQVSGHLPDGLVSWRNVLGV